MPDATYARLIMPGGIAHIASGDFHRLPNSAINTLIFRRSDKAFTPHPTMSADA
ncbi:hypothetical protein L340_1911 [Escherichia coli E2265]|nr:hypothetical protein L340_1911 [Escherichia coli E2265]